MKGHYGFGQRDGSSSFHLGTTEPRECNHPSCIAQFSTKARHASLRDAIRDAVPYLLTASAHSEGLADEAMMPKQIAQRFQEYLDEGR